MTETPVGHPRNALDDVLQFITKRKDDLVAGWLGL
jgi:hypothetical protein